MGSHVPFSRGQLGGLQSNRQLAKEAASPHLRPQPATRLGPFQVARHTGSASESPHPGTGDYSSLLPLPSWFLVCLETLPTLGQPYTRLHAEPLDIGLGGK